jgi:hypothetical protein
MIGKAVRVRSAIPGVLAAMLAAAALAGCGSASERDEARPGSPSAPFPPSSAAAPGPAPAGRREASAPPVKDPIAVSPTRYAAPVPADVAACIEGELRKGSADAMPPRDARRKLLRLQAQAACEERMGLARPERPAGPATPVEVLGQADAVAVDAGR